MRKLISIIFIILPIIIFSQYKISGKVVDYNDSAMENVEVVLQTTDSIALKSELTNEKGEFTISNIKKEDYILSIEYFSDKIATQNISVAKDLDLGVIKTKTKEGGTLGTVVVQAKKPLIKRKVDRLVFNVENSVGVVGGDGMDALKLTPNIRVHNDKISMIGKSGMSIMVNNRLLNLSGDDLISYLKSLKSDDIKSIEVIPVVHLG